MRTTARFLRWGGGLLAVIFASLFGLFAAGEAFASDLPRVPLVLAVVGWVVVAAGLGWLALRRTDVAVPTLLAVTVALVALMVVDGQVDLLGRDQVGPWVTVVSLSALVGLGLLGLLRPTEAGLLLLLYGLGAFLGTVLLHAGTEMPPLRALLGGSAGVVVLPTLTAAVLLLVAGRLTHDQVHFWHGSHRPQVTAAA